MFLFYKNIHFEICKFNLKMLWLFYNLFSFNKSNMELFRNLLITTKSANNNLNIEKTSKIIIWGVVYFKIKE